MKPSSNYIFAGNTGDGGKSSLLSEGISKPPRTNDWNCHQIDCMKRKEEKKGGREEGGRSLS